MPTYQTAPIDREAITASEWKAPLYMSAADLGLWELRMTMGVDPDYPPLIAHYGGWEVVVPYAWYVWPRLTLRLGEGVRE